MSEKLSRRELVAGILLGAAIGTYAALAPKSEPKQREAKPAFNASHDTPYIGAPVFDNTHTVPQALKATATAVAWRTGSSFTPEGDFTDEVFWRVRRGTFVIDVERSKDSARATAWLVGIKDREYYLATAGHVFYEENDDLIWKSVTIFRPGIDNDKFRFTPSTGAIYKDPDNALIRISGEYNSDIPVEVLNFDDAYIPKGGERLLMVGFPWEFEISNNSKDTTITLGQLLTVAQPQPVQDGFKPWYAYTLVDHGLSGSPIVRVSKDKNPVVVATVTGAGDVDLKDSQGNPTKGVVMVASPLSLFSLKQSIDKT